MSGGFLLVGGCGLGCVGEEGRGRGLTADWREVSLCRRVV